MPWSAIITALVELFGPVLVEWLKKWLDEKLRQASTHLPEPHTYATPMAATTALFDKAVASLPLLAFARRTFLRRLKGSAVARSQMIFSGAGPGQLTVEESAEIRDAAGAAENE